jgi:hypothetical protein
MGGVFNTEMKGSANDTLCVFLLRQNELDLFTCLVWFLGATGAGGWEEQFSFSRHLPISVSDLL